MRPKNTPGSHTWRTSAGVTRRRVLQRIAFHRIDTATIRQNATSTPGDSARLTSVELSENAMTSATTATTPSVFPLSARPRADVPGGDPATSGGRLTRRLYRRGRARHQRPGGHAAPERSRVTPTAARWPVASAWTTAGATVTRSPAA